MVHVKRFLILGLIAISLLFACKNKELAQQNYSEDNRQSEIDSLVLMQLFKYEPALRLITTITYDLEHGAYSENDSLMINRCLLCYKKYSFMTLDIDIKRKNFADTYILPKIKEGEIKDNNSYIYFDTLTMLNWFEGKYIIQAVNELIDLDTTYSLDDNSIYNELYK